MELADVAVTGERRTVAAVVALWVGVALLEVLRFADSVHVLDDAWITFRVARTWAETGVVAYQPGAADGATSLLGLLLARAALSLSISPLGLLRVVGAVGHLATVACVILAARELAPRGRTVGAAAAGGAVALSGSLAFHAVSGLETGLWELFAALALLALARARQGKGTLLAMLSVAGAAWTRPEGALLAALTCLALILLGRRRAAAQVAAVGALAAGAVALFRFSHFGVWVPNTFFAKPPDLSQGTRSLLAFLLWGLGGMGVVALWPAASKRAARSIALVGIGMALGSVLTGGDWMPGYRRLTVPFLAVALLAGVAISVARGRWRLASWVAFSAIVTANAASAIAGRDSGRYNPDSMPFVAELARQSPGIDEVALVDIGAFGWSYPGRIYDVAGLTDATIAKSPGTHLEKWDGAHFRERHPALALVQVIAHDPTQSPLIGGFDFRSPAEAQLFSAALRDGYRLHTTVRIARDLYLVALVRSDCSLPEALWGPALPAARITERWETGS